MDPDQLASSEKPADQDPYCLNTRVKIYLVSCCFWRIIYLSTVRYMLICSFGQVKFSMDKYIMPFYLPLDFTISTPLSINTENLKIYA